MTHITELFSFDDLRAEIDNGNVQGRRHPLFPLTIYTYTRHCQYSRNWNNVTTRCRGLIVADDGEIVAWPFPKFFNVSEHGTGQPYAPPLPDEPFTVYEKVDGSLGIVFWWGGVWNVASKGSFTSEQAVWANRWVSSRDTSRLDPNNTYLCEIIYPENRIVVNYDPNLTGLCLLAAYNADGDEIPLDDVRYDWEPVGYPVGTWASFDELPLSVLMRMAAENNNLNGTAVTGTDAEGWVIRYESGVRAKIKFAEYVRLHKIITGINARDVWQAYAADYLAATGTPAKVVASTIGVPVSEALRLCSLPGGAIKPLIEDVPDEFDSWVASIMVGLISSYDAITDAINTAYEEIRADVRDEAPVYGPERRAAYARHAVTIQDPTVRSGIFLKYDGKSTDALVWKSLRPSAADPFRNEEE